MAVAEELQIIIDAKVTQAVKNLKNVQKGLGDTGKASKKMGDIFKSLAGPLALGAVIAGSIKLGKEFSKAASDAEEIGSKYATIFRDISGDADQVASTFAESFGLASSTAKELLGNTGDLLTGLGFTQEGALDLSKQVNTLAADLASFSNFAGGTTGASEALTKALLGEAESAKALGIVINQNTKEYKDAIKFYTEVEGKTLLQAKAFTALQFATEQSGNAIGDVARTFESHANVTRRLEETTKELREELGKALNEGITPMLSATEKLISNFTELVRTGNEVNAVLKGIREGGDNSEASLDALNDTLARLNAERAAGTALGVNKNLVEEIRAVEGLIAAYGIQDTFLIKIKESQLALIRASEDKQALDKLISDEEKIAANRLIKLQFDQLSAEAQQIQLLQEEIDKYATLRSQGAEVQGLLNELIRQRNVLLEEEIEIIDEVITAQDFMYDNGLVKTNEQIEAVKKLNQTYVDLAKIGLGAFASAFEEVGAGNIALWEGFKEAGKDAVSALLKALAEMAIVEAALAFARGRFAKSALFTAAAIGAYTASGFVQSLATGGTFVANEPTPFIAGEGAGSETVTVEQTSGSSSGGGSERVFASIDGGEGFWMTIQRGADDRKFRIPKRNVVE